MSTETVLLGIEWGLATVLLAVLIIQPALLTARLRRARLNAVQLQLDQALLEWALLLRTGAPLEELEAAHRRCWDLAARWLRVRAGRA